MYQASWAEAGLLAEAYRVTRNPRAADALSYRPPDGPQACSGNDRFEPPANGSSPGCAEPGREGLMPSNWRSYVRRRPLVISLAATLLTAPVVHGTAARADCRSEVEAAFQKLKIPDRPYRSEMTITGPDLTLSQAHRETTEFIPPDRMRRTADSPYWFVRLLFYLMDQDPIETIRIGDRTWERIDKKWVELPYGPKFPQEAFSFKALPPDAPIACLEGVRFESRIYAGYQASFRPTAVLMVQMDQMSPSKMQEVKERALKTLREAPPKWHTVLVDRKTGLPAYDVITLTSELDSPTLKIHYTYPRHLAIEPPVQ
jgi:hypothetical protein